jgi:tetratricopeptide (TPR) repeat protein
MSSDTKLELRSENLEGRCPFEFSVLSSRFASLCLCAALAAACTAGDDLTSAASTGTLTLRPPDRPGLQPVSLPDFSTMEASVHEQMRERSSSLQLKIEHADSAPLELSLAYGEMGKLLMAAEQFEAAESCFLNAQALAPDDRRWPYYLGHLYRLKGPPEKSVQSFERALQLQSSDVATLVWLGEAYLGEGRAEAAEPQFAKALTLQPQSVAARFGAGRAALIQSDHARAVKLLGEVLRLDPRATAAHYPLAMAYRALGDVEKAEAHLRQKGDIQILPTDPLMKELDELLQSSKAYDLRGGRALEAGNFSAAEAYFRKGLELAPANPSLGLRLGTTLYQMGDARAALEQFERVVRMSPEFSKAHYSLGVLMAASGRHQEAIDRFSAAVKYEPGYVQAQVGLAGALRQSGRLQESLAAYQEALKLDSSLPDAALGHAMTLVGLRRYQAARDALAETMKDFPDQLAFPHALARLLAAAPDDRVRDGRRAMAMVQRLLEKEQSIELGETLAMTFAELGQYERAAAVQREVMAATERAGQGDVARRMAENLRRYERREPCRTPWRDGEMP